ncbi:MAG: hypothetical protein WBV64_18800 [Mycobacterium sp.]
MTLEPLKVDAELLGAAGQRLLTAAEGLPDAPEAFTPAYGSDALSQALSVDVPKAEAPIIEGLPPLKQNAIGTAESVVEAARRYASADSHLKRKIDEQMGQSASGGRFGGGAPAASSAAGAAASAGEQLGQVGAMLSTPMQMAQQAGQAAQQAAGMVTSLPQAAKQGAQQVGEQITQMVEQFGGKDSHEPEGGAQKQAEGAASGQSDGERASASPPSPVVPKSGAQTDPTINH